MEKQLAAKKNHVIPIILGIIIVILIITVLLQNRHINRLGKELSNITLAEKNQPVSNKETFDFFVNVKPEVGLEDTVKFRKQFFTN